MTVVVEVECIRLYRSEPEGGGVFSPPSSYWMMDYEGPDVEVLGTRRTTFPGHADPYAVKSAVEGAAGPGIMVYFDWRDHPGRRVPPPSDVVEVMEAAASG